MSWSSRQTGALISSFWFPHTAAFSILVSVPCRKNRTYYRGLNKNFFFLPIKYLTQPMLIMLLIVYLDIFPFLATCDAFLILWTFIYPSVLIGKFTSVIVSQIKIRVVQCRHLILWVRHCKIVLRRKHYCFEDPTLQFSPICHGSIWEVTTLKDFLSSKSFKPCLQKFLNKYFSVFHLVIDLLNLVIYIS